MYVYCVRVLGDVGCMKLCMYLCVCVCGVGATQSALTFTALSLVYLFCQSQEVLALNDVHLDCWNSCHGD